MLLITHLDDLPSLNNPCGLTIGVFDGVHVGHQSLLSHLRSQLPMNSVLAVLTFSNHPADILSSPSSIPLICPPLQKAKLLFEYGADLVMMLSFSQEFANWHYDKLVTTLHKKLHFKWLTLGQGAAFGKARAGNEEKVQEWGKIFDFTATYLPKVFLHHHLVSSRHIRALIQQSAFQEVEACLGRPYSLMGHPVNRADNLFCPFPGICLPPEGDYEVRVRQVRTEHESPFIQAIAQVSHHENGIYLKGAKVKTLTGKEVQLFLIQNDKS